VKRYTKKGSIMKDSKLIGKIAHIKNNIDSQEAGGYGRIVAIIGNEYHIAMYGDTDFCLVFTRDEFVIRRERKQK
jgi:hypothetical protein